MVCSVWVQAARTEDYGVFNSLAEWLVPLVPRARLAPGKQRAIPLGMPRTGSRTISPLQDHAWSRSHLHERVTPVLAHTGTCSKAAGTKNIFTHAV